MNNLNNEVIEIVEEITRSISTDAASLPSLFHILEHYGCHWKKDDDGSNKGYEKRNAFIIEHVIRM